MYDSASGVGFLQRICSSCHTWVSVAITGRSCSGGAGAGHSGQSYSGGSTNEGGGRTQGQGSSHGSKRIYQQVSTSRMGDGLHMWFTYFDSVGARKGTSNAPTGM